MYGCIHVLEGSSLIPPFSLSRPSSLAAALDLVTAGGVPLVGGTELVAAMNIGLLSPEHLVDLKRITELSGIESVGNELIVGATTRHAQVAASGDVRHGAPILAQACDQLGNQRVRSTGSIGGNLCFADHRSDVATVLVALQAEAELITLGGARTVRVEDFLFGSMDTDLRDGELMTRLRVPARGAGQVYLRHQPSEYPTVCVAVVWDPAGPHFLRIVIGAVADRPHVLEAADPDRIDLAAALEEMDIVEDLNGSVPYKQHLVEVFVARALDLARNEQSR